MGSYREECGIGFLAPSRRQSGMQSYLLGRVRVVANDERDPQGFTEANLCLRGVEIRQMPEIVGRPECMVERPWAAEFERDTRGRRFIALRPSVKDGIGLDSVEDIARGSTSHQRLAPDEPNRHFRKFLQLRIREIV